MELPRNSSLCRQLAREAGALVRGGPSCPGNLVKVPELPGKGVPAPYGSPCPHPSRNICSAKSGSAYGTIVPYAALTVPKHVSSRRQ